jgi:hypothetical protein
VRWTLGTILLILATAVLLIIFFHIAAYHPHH